MKRTPHYRVLRLLLLATLCLATLPGGVAHAQTQPPLVYLSPEQVDIAIGETVDLHVMVVDVAALWGTDIRMTFDPAILEAVDLDSGRDGIQVHSGDFPYPDMVMRNEVNNSSGTIWYVVTQLAPRLPTSGAGMIFTVRFRAKAGGTSLIDPQNVQLADSNSTFITTDVLGGAVNVDSGGSPTVQPQPTSTATPTPQAQPSETPVPLTATPPAFPTATRTPPANGAYPGGTLTPASLATATRTPTRLAMSTPSLATTPTTLVLDGYPGLASTPKGGSPFTPGATLGSGAGLTETMPAGTPPVRSTRPVTAEQSPTTLDGATPTGGQLAELVPTKPSASPNAAARTTTRPLIPREMFICLGVLLALFTAALLFYLVRQPRANR